MSQGAAVITKSQYKLLHQHFLTHIVKFSRLQVKCLAIFTSDAVNFLGLRDEQCERDTLPLPVHTNERKLQTFL